MRRRLIILGYLTIAAFLLAHLVNSWIGEALSSLPPVPPSAVASEPRVLPQADLRKMAEEILSSGFFPLPQTDPASLDQGLKPVAGASLDAARKIKLVGTVITEGIIPFAVVEDLTTKRQTLFHLLEQIPAVGQIAEIRADAILLKAGGEQEVLELNPGRAEPAATPAAAASPAATGAGALRKVVDQREVAQSMADLPKLLSEARVGPVYANGKMDGWKIEGINPKSFYERIGLRAGDVLQRVNGVEIRDPGMILSLFQQLKDEKSVSLDMLREGRKTTMLFEIR